MKNFLMTFLLCLLSLALIFPPVHAVTPPSNAQLIDVRTFGAKGDGINDDTKAIQEALDAAAQIVNSPNQISKVVYLPDGIYSVSDSLQWQSKRIILQGQSRDKTILKLKDNSPKFSSDKEPLPVITTFEGESTGQAFHNGIYDLTVDIGSGNPNAIGIRFLNNNSGGIRNVTIKSSDNDKVGNTGLALTRAWVGPALIRDVSIIGFDYGIQVRQPEYSIVFEHITLQNQRVAGIDNEGNIITFRDLKSHNSVPVIENINSDIGLVVVVDADFTGGAGDIPAIHNRRGFLYARNIKTSGYKSAIKDKETEIPGNTVEEYVSAQVYSLFPSPKHSLNLPVEETPDVGEDDLRNWASVTDFGANGTDDQDDADAIQKAIDSGKSTIYFPNGKYLISKTIRVRNNVKRIKGFFSSLQLLQPAMNAEGPVFRFEDGKSKTVVFEQFWGEYDRGAFYWFEQATPRTLVLKNLYLGWGKVYRNTVPGTLFIEDVTGYQSLLFDKQKVWARQLNVESATSPQIKNDGGSVWILGLKTEDEGTVVETTNNGKTEILGGLIYPAAKNIPKDRPAFINDNSQFSISTRTSIHQGGRYETFFQEKRGNEIKFLKSGDLPKIGERNIIPLYVGYEGSANAELTSGLDANKGNKKHCNLLTHFFGK
ncbi:MAG: glycoside hydrolase family 55 protein [Calothrix sp. C42_A2020_038]|nr:glycoside hydrolase family 55 protein [Calothrix sp. C42_A2020_038]